MIPLIVIGAITLGDALGPDVDLGPLLVAAPATAALFAGPKLICGITILAGTAGVSLDIHDGDTATIPIHLATGLVVSGIAIVFSALRERSRQELTEVRAVSEAAQRVVLRPLPQQLGPLRIATLYQASDEHAKIGGDLYAAARTANATRLIIGDVRGKGLLASQEAAAVLGAFREAAYGSPSLPQLAVYLEGSVRRHLEEIADIDHDAGERFVTALILEIPDDKDVVRTVSCGHPAPLRLRHGDSVSVLHSHRPAPPLGLGSLTLDAYHQDNFTLRAGDTLLLHTDGIVEARNTEGDFYPIRDRVTSWTATDLDQLLQYVRDDLLSHVGGHLKDDAAMVALQRTPTTLRSRTRAEGIRVNGNSR